MEKENKGTIFETDLTDEELKLFEKLPRITLVRGINNKETYLNSDVVFNEIIKYKEVIDVLFNILKRVKFTATIKESKVIEMFKEKRGLI